MDPDAALAEIRALCAAPDSELNGGDGVLLAELVIGLDGWLTRGGFLPKAWRAGR